MLVSREDQNQKSAAPLQSIEWSAPTDTKIVSRRAVFLGLLSLVLFFLISLFQISFVLATVFAALSAFVAFLEVIVSWYVRSQFWGARYRLSQEGLEVVRGKVKNFYPWNSFQCFTTAFDSKYGSIFSRLPNTGLYLFPVDRFLIRLYYQLNPVISLRSVTIRALPSNLDSIIEYIGQHLPRRRQRYSYGRPITVVLILWILLVIALVVYMFIAV